MKNRIFTCILLLLLLISIISIHVEALNINSFESIGFKSGWVNSNIESDFFFENRTKSGMDISLFIESEKFKAFKIVSEIHYTQKGIIDAYAIFDPLTFEILDMYELKHRLDYLSISILLKFYKELDVITPFLLVGPRFDYLFNYRSDIYDILFNEVYNFVVGADAAIGVEMFIHESLKGIFELRYSYDITVSEDSYNSKNKSFQILIGMKIPLKELGIGL